MFYLFFIFNAIFYTLITACYYYIPLYLYLNKDINVWQLSLLLLIMFGSAIIGNMPNIISILSLKFTVMISILILILVLYSIMIIDYWLILLLVFILFGFVRENVFINTESLIIQHFPKNNFGIWRLYRSIFEFTGVFLSSYIISIYSYNSWFYIIISLCFILFIFSLFLPNKSNNNFSYEVSFNIIPIALLVFIIYVQIGNQYVNIGMFAIKNLLLSFHDIGMYVSFKYLCIGISMFLFYYIKVHYKNLLTYGCFIYGISLFLSAYTDVFIYSFILRLIYGFAEGAIFIGLLNAVWNFAEKYQFNNVNIFIIISILGISFGAWIFFIIGYNFGFQNALMISAILITFLAYPVKTLNI